MKATAIALVSACSMLPAAASAATFLVDFSINGSQGFTGLFDAPSGGGAVSNFTATIDGVVFDVQDGGLGFAYDPTINDFDMTASFTNSNVSAICPVLGTCDLTLFPDPDPLIPGDYQAVAANLSNFDDGTKYEISVIPVPAGFPLLLTCVTIFGLMQRGRKGGQSSL